VICRWPPCFNGCLGHLEAFTDLILRSALLRASRRMAASRMLPSFETLASQSPQDEAGVFPDRARGRPALLVAALDEGRRTTRSTDPTGKSPKPCPAPFAKYSDFPNTQITFITLSVLSHRGAARDRHRRGTGCGGRRQRQRRGRLSCGRQNRVVLTPRRWRQVPE
jgi:hypothetical protein